MNKLIIFPAAVLLLASACAHAPAQNAREYTGGIAEEIRAQSFPEVPAPEKPAERPAAPPQRFSHIPPPVYVSELAGLNEYDIFANSGWDGNWYVGYNVCWIKRLARPPDAQYARAFIGVKLGRAKTQPVPGKAPWEREAVPGAVYAAIASTPAWSSDQRRFLVSTRDMPLEAEGENALEGAGEARWFWAEVPLEQVNFAGDNFIAVWSPTDYFVSRASAPILCGGWGIKGGPKNTWLNDTIQGSPPIDPSASLKIPISVFEPAIALKLIPEGCLQAPVIIVTDIRDNPKTAGGKAVTVSVYGSQMDRAWLEYFDKKTGDWTKAGRYVYDPPYVFSLNPGMLPPEKTEVRAACVDTWGNPGYSEPFEVKPVK